MINILVLNGPNLNLLGKREPGFYGTATMDSLKKRIEDHSEEKNVNCDVVQTNSEYEILDWIHSAENKYQGIIINPAGLGYSSIALRDALLTVNLPAIEVHLSNIQRREKFRHRTVISDVVIGQISGFKSLGYCLAIDALIEEVNPQSGA